MANGNLTKTDYLREGNKQNGLILYTSQAIQLYGKTEYGLR